MLSLDRVNTLTIYSSKEINDLYHQFRKKQNSLYESQSSQDFLDLEIFLKIIYTLVEVPQFAQQLNQIGDIFITSNLEILFVKASTWKSPQKELFKGLAGNILGQYQKQVKTFTRKEQMRPQKQQNIEPIPFFDFAFREWSSHAAELVNILVSSFRLFLLNQLQNKKSQFQFTQNSKLTSEWQNIQRNMIAATKQVGTLKHQQICISLSYWLCSIEKLFVTECLQGGMVSFLLRTLSKKGISEWYGKKIIGFLKILLLDAPSSSIPVRQFENNLSKFSQLHDKPEILSLISDLMKVVESKLSDEDKKDKFQNLRQFYEKYQNDKNQTTLTPFLDYLRVMILYGKSDSIKKDLSKDDNLDFLMQCLREQSNLLAIKELSTLLLTHSETVDSSIAIEIMADSVRKVQKILSSKEKDLRADNKKHLINICKILKQILNRKDTHSNMADCMKKLCIQEKLMKFSDGKVFNYEKHLYEFKKMLMQSSGKSSQQLQQPDPKFVLESLQNQLLANKMKKAPGQEELQQAKLLNDIITRDPPSIKKQIVRALPRTIYDYGDQNSRVSVAILDNSESEHLRNIKNQLNYFAVDSLSRTAPLPGNEEVFLDENVLEKVIKTGLTSYDNRVLQSAALYVRQCLTKNPVSGELQQPLRDLQNKLSEQGYEQDSAFIQAKLKLHSKNKVPVDIIMSFLDKSENKVFDQTFEQDEISSVLSVLPDLEPQNLDSVLTKLKQRLESKGGNFKLLKIYLSMVYRLSQKQSQKKAIFDRLSPTLKNMVPKLRDQNELLPKQNLNLLYLIFSETFLAPQQKQRNQYFGPILIDSYETTSRESIKFTEQCLSLMPYQPPSTQNRGEIYFKFVYNIPELIGREAAHQISGTDRQQQEQKFWLKFKNLVTNSLQQENTNALNFMLLYTAKSEKKTWDRHHLESLYQITLHSYGRALQKIQNEQHLSGEHLKTCKLLIKIIHEANKNQKLDLSNKYPEQNQIVLHSAEKLGQQIAKHPNLKNHLQPLIIQLLQIMVLTYRSHQGSKQLTNDPAKYSNLWKVLQKLSEQRINDLCLQIIRIGLIKDLDQTQHKTLEKFVQIHKDSWKTVITSEGAQHLEAIYRVLQGNAEKKQHLLKQESLLYFFGEGESLDNFYQEQQKTLNRVPSIPELTAEISDQQLLKHLKNLLHPPYMYGLNTLTPFLRKIESNQFANTLIRVYARSPQLYKEDGKANISLERTQEIIADSISPSHADLIEEFYQMIAMNKTGMQICLIKRGIGVKGVSLVVDRMQNSSQDIPFCAQILHFNANSEKELTILHDRKIPSLVNDSYIECGVKPEYGRSLGNLIGTSSKMKRLQENYKVTDHLLKNIHKFSEDSESLGCTFFALAGLVYMNKENQVKVGLSDIVKHILQIVIKHIKSPLVVQNGCKLLSNLIYKNYGLKKIYIELSVPQNILSILRGYLMEQKYPYGAVKQILKLIGNLSLELDVALKLSKLNFMSVCAQLIDKAHQSRHQDIIKYTIDILYNMVDYPDTEVKMIALRMYQQGYLPCILGTLKNYLLSSEIVQSCLDSYDAVCMLDVINNASMELNVFGILADVEKTQQWNEEILQKWIQVIYKLCLGDQQVIKMLQSAVLLSAASFVKVHSIIKPKTIRVCFGIIDKVQKSRFKFYHVKSGFIDFAVQLLTVQNVEASDIYRLIQLIESLHNQKLLHTQLYVKIFQALINRLQIEFRDQNGRRIICLLKRIKEKIIVSARPAAVLLEFSYYFLTQSEILHSTAYHHQVRQFISLLAFFISFNIDLRLLFKEEGFIDILKSWIKINTLLEEDNTITEACRMCLIAMLNDQKFLVTLNEEIDFTTPKEQLKKGYKCHLYRKDKSNKSAITKLNPQNNQIVSFKAPDGQLKEKYRLPIQNVINLRHTYVEGDGISHYSLFEGAGNLFTKAPELNNCLTLYGLVGENLSIRQFNLEFSTAELKEEFANNLKIVISESFRKKDLT